MTGLQATNKDWSDVTWKEAPKSSTQDEGALTVEEAATETHPIELEPRGMEEVPRPRATWPAQNSANFSRCLAND